MKKAKLVEPSERGEIEITSLNNIYLNEKRLKVIPLGRGYSWLDTGTNESLVEASNLIMSIEQRSGLKVGCIEEIALNNKWIGKKEINKSIKFYGNCNYSKYLKDLI